MTVRTQPIARWDLKFLQIQEREGAALRGWPGHHHYVKGRFPEFSSVPGIFRDGTILIREIDVN